MTSRSNGKPGGLMWDARMALNMAHAAAVPGGDVAYSVGVRALQGLEQEGAFAPPSPPPAGHSRAAVRMPHAHGWGRQWCAPRTARRRGASIAFFPGPRGSWGGHVVGLWIHSGNIPKRVFSPT